MGRSNKRKHREFAYENGNADDFGVGHTLSQMKRPRLSEDNISPTAMDSSEVMAPASNGDDNERNKTETGEWQTVQSRKKQKAQNQGQPSSYPEIIFHMKQQVPIRIQDLQNLALYTLADGVGPSWLAFKNSHQTRKVVALMVPGLEMEMFDGSWKYGASELNGNGQLSNKKVEGSRNGDAAESTSTARLTAQVGQQQDGFRAWKNGSVPPKRAPSFAGSPIYLDPAYLPAVLEPLTSMFNYVWPVRSPGDSRMNKLHSPLQAMLVSAIPAQPEIKDIKGVRPPAEEKLFRPVRTPITSFIHSAEDLREADYPVHPASFASAADAQLELERRVKTGQSVSAGWVDTNIAASTPILLTPTAPASDLSCGLDIYSLDCEMVLTSDNVYSLARISILSYTTGTIVLDKYVKPSLPIENYFTQYSGITPEHLENVTTTLQDIQAELLSLLTPSTILIGHSLESDLNALKLTHPFLIDTALIYPHPRGMPLRSSLKYLSTKYLRRDIQSSAAGHDSVEDARAVLDLVKLKCEKGPKWGTSEAQGESIFRRLSRAKGKEGVARTSAIVEYGTPERGYGKEADVKIGCSNDDEIVEGVIRAVNGDPDGKDIKAGGVDFIWGRLRGLEFAMGWSKDINVGESNSIGPTKRPTSADAADGIPSSAPPPTFPHLSQLGKTVTHLQHIHSALPPCTLLLVYSGTGDPRDLVRLQAQQAQYRKEFKVKRWDELSVKWTDDEEQALRAAAEKARNGVGFVCVK